MFFLVFWDVLLGWLPRRYLIGQRVGYSFFKRFCAEGFGHVFQACGDFYQEAKWLRQGQCEVWNQSLDWAWLCHLLTGALGQVTYFSRTSLSSDVKWV